MFNVCHECGRYRADKTVDPAGPFAVCPECGHEHPFRYRPLFVLTGASGAGKSTTLHELVGARTDVVPLESDVLWGVGTEMTVEEYADLWLRLCKNLHQSGRPVVLAGAGLTPENVEPRTERRYFPTVHYLALVCDDDALDERLRARPAWRESGGEAFRTEQLAYNGWFRERAADPDHPIDAVDTTDRSVAETVISVNAWLDERLSAD